MHQWFLPVFRLRQTDDYWRKSIFRGFSIIINIIWATKLSDNYWKNWSLVLMHHSLIYRNTISCIAVYYDLYHSIKNIKCVSRLKSRITNISYLNLCLLKLMYLYCHNFRLLWSLSKHLHSNNVLMWLIRLYILLDNLYHIWRQFILVTFKLYL